MLAPTNRGRMTFQQLAVVSPQETDNNIYRAYYYDRKGRVILTKELDREGNPSCYWVKYDDAGHILTTVEEHRIPDSNLPDFKRVDYTYDAQGRMLNETTTVDREGSAIRSVSTFVYDEFDREAYLRGELAPVFFGSAVNNFGVPDRRLPTSDRSSPMRAGTTATSRRRAGSTRTARSSVTAIRTTDMDN